ncbi:MAG TPA: response regulator transcription factor, partial [Anaerolineales bacterium]
MITVAIVEDHQVFAQALELMLRNQPGYQFAGSAYTLEEGYTLIKNVSPDVLLLDIGLPDGDGLKLVPFVKQTSQNTQVVALTCQAASGWCRGIVERVHCNQPFAPCATQGGPN